MDMVRLIMEAAVLVFLAGKYVQQTRNLGNELTAIRENLEEINGTVHSHDIAIPVMQKELELLAVRIDR